MDRPGRPFGQGSVEYEGAVLAITGIGLRDGAFVVTAEAAGPLDAYCGPVRLYGPDGVLVQSGGRLDCPAARKGQVLRAELACTPETPAAREMTAG